MRTCTENAPGGTWDSVIAEMHATLASCSHDEMNL
jgi:hypothetical protein